MPTNRIGLTRAKKVFDTEIASLRSVKALLDNQFPRAVEAIKSTIESRGKVVIAGVGKSGNIAKKIAATFTSTGTPSVVLHTVNALHGDLGLVNDGDIVLLLSYSGESEELLTLAQALNAFSVQTITISGNPKSSIAKQSDIHLNVKVPKEACPFNLAPTSSTTATLVMGDALAMAVLEARGFREEDYARFHPSGSIGKALLLRAADIMRDGDRNAVAPSTMTVKDALLIMSEARSGSISIVTAKGKLTGVFTDGDLRRLIADNVEQLNKKLSSVMTKNPITISSDALAVEALKIFNERNIDDLIVVNDKGAPIGMIDTQDLPKLKLL